MIKIGKTYTEVFKKQAVSLLNKLNSEGFVIVNKKRIENVRDLVKAIGISRDSLYKWRKLVTPKKPEAKKEKKKRKGTIRHEKFKAEQEELRKEKEARLKAKDLEKLSEEEQAFLEDIEAEDLDVEIIAGRFVIDILGGRFVGALAQGMRVKGYSRMKLSEMMRKVGQFYIDKSKGK